MYELFAQQAWAPQFKEAAELLAQKDPIYWTEHDRKLSKTGEVIFWEPDEQVLEYVENLYDIQVVLFSDICSTKEQKDEMFANILEEDSAGLVLMGPIIDRNTRPYAIILTLRDKYLVFDPAERLDIIFLYKLMAKPEFKLYMTNVIQEADCLKHQYGIDLNNVQAQIACATGTHIYMMQSLRHMDAACASKYPKLARTKAKRRVVEIIPFDELVEIWLDVEKEHILFDNEQLVQLKTRPLSIAAKNVIKKRCCLVVQLNEVLQEFSMIEFQWASELTYNTLTICNDKIARELRKDLLAERKQREATEDDTTVVGRPIPGLSDLLGFYANYGAGVSTQAFKKFQDDSY